MKTFSRGQAFQLMSHTRALPIQPGGFLAWRHDVFHWGGAYWRGTQDRLRMASRPDMLNKA
jgi:hypothetical protein